MGASHTRLYLACGVYPVDPLIDAAYLARGVYLDVFCVDASHNPATLAALTRERASV